MVMMTLNSHLRELSSGVVIILVTPIDDIAMNIRLIFLHEQTVLHGVYLDVL